jgi:hypothetical protein
MYMNSPLTESKVLHFAYFPSVADLCHTSKVPVRCYGIIIYVRTDNHFINIICPFNDTLLLLKKDEFFLVYSMF